LAFAILAVFVFMREQVLDLALLPFGILGGALVCLTLSLWLAISNNRKLKRLLELNERRKEIVKGLSGATASFGDKIKR
jgi:hypothetical protein